MDDKGILRRPIPARNTRWAAAIAVWLARIGLRPNQISLLSVLCAGLAAACLFLSARSTALPLRILLFLGAAAFIQLRLLCNLFDGMVAVEGGFKTKSGEIYNELPDRISDALVFVAAGYSLPGTRWVVELGWTAALLAVMTAYVRSLGGAAGASQHFCGPMAKQQRMMAVTLACLIDAAGAGMKWPFHAIAYVLPVVVVGCVVTIIRRTMLIIKDLESK